MNNEEEDKILEAIEADVKSNASLVEDVLQKETDSFHEDQLAFFREGLKKETDSYLEKELHEARLAAASASSRDQMETKKKLLRLRDHLADELFDSVREDLRKFVKTPEYEKYLMRSVKSLPVSETGVFMCRRDDVPVLKDAWKKEGLSNRVEERPMELGGFLYRDDAAGREYSCVLEDRLEEEMDWFRANSGFKAPSGKENA